MLRCIQNNKDVCCFYEHLRVLSCLIILTTQEINHGKMFRKVNLLSRMTQPLVADPSFEIWQSDPRSYDLNQ